MKNIKSEKYGEISLFTAYISENKYPRNFVAKFGTVNIRNITKFFRYEKKIHAKLLPRRHITKPEVVNINIIAMKIFFKKMLFITYF